MTTTTPLPDLDARKIALTAVDRSFLIEAGAGSGKTSVMAGRVAILLSSGVDPKHVAAITFTEFAASELSIRIERFVGKLAEGEIPKDLAIAFPNGVTIDQRQNLNKARSTLDQLTCTTIHGFAMALIKPYPVEAGVDPGAQIMDPGEADVAFDEHYDAWLREHLSGSTKDDLIAELVLADEDSGLTLVRTVADFIRRNRNARPADTAPAIDLIQAVTRSAINYEKEIRGFDFREVDTENTCNAFIELARVLSVGNLDHQQLSNKDLVAAIVLPRHKACFTLKGTKRQLKTKGKWEKAACGLGKRKQDGSQAFMQVEMLYDACHAAFEALLSAAASETLNRLVDSMAGLAEKWSGYKHSAALLDFDDLLYTARDLLLKHDSVREALSKRFCHVLVDEFQDTDPLQTELFWRLCGQAPEEKHFPALSCVLRPGTLFLVGDPKQAIYRFRGADVNAYIDARTAIGGQALFQITANFRSVEPILSYINGRFQNPLSQENGQPGFTAMAPIRAANGKEPSVMALDVKLDCLDPKAEMRRDAEAEQVAEICGRLVGNFLVRDNRDADERLCRFGDIALLAPVGTDLWRFEEALEKRDIPVSTQAGKGFFRRQEIHDLIALTRTLANGRDTLSLGSLLRSPLVGLTEAELLDISEQLPTDPDQPGRLPQMTLWTESEHIRHPLAKSVLGKLQALGKRAGSTTPYMLLADAISIMDVRSHLRQRFKTTPERALANVDLFVEMARAYDVRGLRAFAADMRANWEESFRQVEGRPDAEEHSVVLITIHAAKGLEWPIVIPINMTGDPRSDSGLMYDRRSGQFSLPVLGAEPADYERLTIQTREEHKRERVRLWYVATTRARDLLLLPRHDPPLNDACWTHIVDLDLKALPCIDVASLGTANFSITPPSENPQTRGIFAEEAGRITAARREMAWLRPSRHDGDISPSDELPILSGPEVPEITIEDGVREVKGSATRGTILHKLMEEVLTGETLDSVEDLEARAVDLLKQLRIISATDPATGISPKELAEAIIRTLTIPTIKELRPRLVPEYSVYGAAVEGTKEILVSGIADALAFDANGKISVVIDWKSDIEINPALLSQYRNQIKDYKKHTGAARALLVLMTAGTSIEC